MQGHVSQTASIAVKLMMVGLHMQEGEVNVWATYLVIWIQCCGTCSSVQIAPWTSLMLRDLTESFRPHAWQ